MFIAKNLRRLRLDKGMTQEDIAERLGVTGQAISKWERDECYPDITLLPGLANLFGVTVDELLGMEEMCDEAKRNDVFRRMHEMGNQGKYGDIVEMMEAMLKVFPSDPGMLYSLGTAHALMGDAAGRAIPLCELALAECTSNKQRGTILATLCFLYKRYGMMDKAEKLARSLPHARESRELMLPNFLKQPQRDEYLRENLPGILTTICALIDRGSESCEEELRTLELGTYRGDASMEEALEKIRGFICN